MDRRTINPWTWQDRYGYVQANEVTGARKTIHCAGQVSVDEDGTMLHAGNMAGQIRLCFKNLETVLAESGADLSHVVRLSYYITDMAAFREAGSTLKGILAASNCRPASTLLGVAFLFHPDAMIEIEATAVL